MSPAGSASDGGWHQERLMGKAQLRSGRSLRCAVYTRKSSEEGLEQEFNSLHAQREACEAFIRSQRQEGWSCLPQAYDEPTSAKVWRFSTNQPVMRSNRIGAPGNEIGAHDDDQSPRANSGQPSPAAWSRGNSVTTRDNRP
jgi:hypothetical protein